MDLVPGGKSWRPKQEQITIITCIHYVFMYTCIHYVFIHLNPGSQRKNVCYSIWLFFFIFIGGQECVGHCFAYVALFWFLRDVWIRTESVAVASGRPTNLATHPLVSHPSPGLATHPPLLIILIKGSVQREVKGI